MIERQYRETAAELREEGRIDMAASYYTSSAFGYLMKFRKLDDQNQERSPTKFGYFGSTLLLGALCHRLVGAPERCRTHCQMGILVTEDICEYETPYGSEAAPWIGLCHELVGDLRLVGDIGSYEDAYRTAEQHYITVENQRQWSAEPEFELQIMRLMELADGVGYDIPEETKGKIQYQSLEERIRFKRDHFEEIVTAVIDAGNWGSTSAGRNDY